MATAMASLATPKPKPRLGTDFSGGNETAKWLLSPSTAAAEVSYMRRTSRKKKGGVRAMIGAAIRGARIEVSKGETSSERLKIAAVLGMIIAKEILGMILLIPYGLHALGIYRALASAKTEEKTEECEEGGNSSKTVTTSSSSEKRGSEGVVAGENRRLGPTRSEEEEEALLAADRQVGPQQQQQQQQRQQQQQQQQYGVEPRRHSAQIVSGTIRRRASFPQSLRERHEGADAAATRFVPNTSSSSDTWRRRKSEEFRVRGERRGGGSGARLAPRQVGNRLLTWLAPKERSVSIVRDVRYGIRERNLLDIYVPNNIPKNNLLPTVVFVHGGVWASGEKWQYSPIGVRLAKEGTVAVLVQYTLFPEVLADDMIKDVSSALTWVMDNVHLYSGNPGKIFLMGHSSGAHVSAMVIWQRALQRLKHEVISLGQEGDIDNDLRSTRSVRKGTDVEHDSEMDEKRPAARALNGEVNERQEPEGQNGSSNIALAQGLHGGEVDSRQPYCFLGLSGVYDIGCHYAFEQRRGVAGISCMRPAMGGVDRFDALSPSRLFASMALMQTSDNDNGARSTSHPGWANVRSSSTLYSLRGERSAAHATKSQIRLFSDMDDDPQAGAPQHQNSTNPVGSQQPDCRRRNSEKSTCLVPPCLLLCSPGDKTVPVDSSLAFEQALLQVGCRAKAILYDDLGHTDFSIWGTHAHRKTGDELGPHVSDILDVVSERIPLDSIRWV